MKERILSTIRETEESLEKAIVKYNNVIKALKIEIAENKELGNPVSANRDWVEYALEAKARVKRLENHIAYLKNMLVEC